MPFQPSIVALLLAATLAALPAAAVELPMDLGTLTTRDNKVYENAKIIGSDAVGVKVTHDAGTARVPFNRLPRELAEKFEVKPGAAAEQLRKEKEDAAAHDRETARAMAKADREAADKAIEKALSDPARLEAALPEDMRHTAFEEMIEARDADAGRRITYLENFIELTYRQIDGSKKEIHRRSEQAAKAFEQGRAEEQDDVKSRVKVNRRPSRIYAGLREGDRINQWIAKEREKIGEAEARIAKAAAEIRSLRKNAGSPD
ncbi:hypothetical protein OVA24_06605 [Luteolibacter sp. SL250]|uniref:hypothetical protein n=1 Tax=Luteolibacter sp. SL250 TaxID=2995170 RepID=UPI00226F3F1D|nr:hypothetical protein [Luteolibacter sp. SL250]WAC21052.1 hypothetical protein OVA24_06605 [Luteolibacter sp. SL250]